MAKIGIYKIKCKINNKIYIGSTINLVRRKCNHFTKLDNKIHHNIHLQRSYEKHGKNNFEFIILEECSKDMLILKEQYYIDTYKPEYNILKIAGSSLGRKLSKEHKNKIKISLKAINFKPSIRGILESNKLNQKKVYQYTTDKIFIREYDSISEAGRISNLGSSRISRCCNGKLYKSGNFIWTFNKI